MKVISGSFTITAVEDGEDAVSMVISPQNIVAKKGVGYQTYSFDVSVVKGGTKIKQGEWTVDYKVNGVYSGNYVIDGVLYFDNVTLKDDYTLHYEFILYPESIADTDLAFVISYGGVSYPQTVSLKTLTEPEIYEIVLTNAYCVYNPNEESDNVIGLIEGHLYKVVGDRRVAMSGVPIEYGYSETIGQELDGEPLYDTTDTEDDGFFTSEGWFGDTYGGEYVGNSKSIIARYKKDGNVVAQVNVGISQYGLNGLKGERGAPLRVTEWSDGWTYYNGKGANDPYTDVVKYNGYWYLCKTSHRSNQVNHPSGTTENTSNWEAASQFDMIATKVFLAANAHIDLLGSNTIEVKDSLGNTTAGMTGGDGVQLWAGGGRDTAKFRVKEDGDVHVEGMITAKALYRGITNIRPYALNNEPYYHGMETNDPVMEDFIVIADDQLWQNVPTIPAPPYSGAPLYIPNPENYKGKEILIRNGLARSSDIDNKNVNIRITTSSGNASMTGGYFYDTSGGDNSGISTVVRQPNNLGNQYLETVRLVSDGNYWVVFEKVYID